MADKDKSTNLNNNKSASRSTNKGTSNHQKSGVQKVLDGVEKGVRVAGKVFDIMKIFGINHQEWYTHYDTSRLIALNLAYKQNANYESINAVLDDGFKRTQFMPNVASFKVLLTPVAGDLDGWKSGVRLIYQQLYTANGGKVNFTQTDLEKYIYNVRLLHALAATLKRLYRLTYTFESTASNLPYDMIYSLGIDPKDVMAHAAEIYMYQQRFMQQIKVNFPLKLDLYDRTWWIFTNVFMDSPTDKPSYYIPNLKTGGNTYDSSLWYFVSANDTEATSPWTKRVYTLAERKATWNDIITMCETIKNTLLDDQKMALIAAYVIKAYGDKAFYPMEPASIAETQPFVYDQSVLNQLQNATVLSIAESWSATMDNDRRSQTWLNITQNPSNSWIEANIAVSLDIQNQNLNAKSDAVLNALADRINSPLINWHDDTINAGQVMSITRWVVSNGAHHRENAQTHVMQYHTFGTEVITDVYAISRVGTGPTAFLDTEPNVVPMAGTLTFNTNEIESSYIFRNVFMWANFDWCPRMRFMTYYTTASTQGQTNGFFFTSISSDILDWDVFADVSKETLATYYSYANQSLLYAGPSFSQNTSHVYSKSANNSKNYNKGAANTRSRVQPEDKR